MSTLVSVGMSEVHAELLEAQLRFADAPAAQAILDQLWLRTALLVARRQTRVAERAAFDERADRILAAVGP